MPGEFAAWEARRALERGLNVFMFSANVPIEDEVELKKMAVDRGLLMMGPDCGTAIINGVGLGFANAVNRGPIGMVGAAGTGIQEVASLVSDESGISHAIGTGGRDLDERVGGIMTIEGIRALDEDDETKVIAVISKRPSPLVEERVLRVISGCGKPVIVNFAGGDPSVIRRAGAIPAATLEEVAMRAVALVKGRRAEEVPFTAPYDEVRAASKREYERLSGEQRYIRGLFSGGSFCSEAMVILTGLIGDVYSNVPLKPGLRLEDPSVSHRHTCLDMGTEEFTMRRAHPIIDVRLRQQRLIKEAKDPETAVILLDIVLGYGAHQDPSGAFAPVIERAREEAGREGRYVSVVASVCGTDKDPQNKRDQERKLREAGVIVMPSNAQATRMASLIASRGRNEDKIFRS